MIPHITFLAILIAANLALLVPPLRPVGAVALTLALPGWGWAALLWPNIKSLPNIILTLGFSFAITILGTLLLHYFPGPIQIWQLLLLLNTAAIVPLLANGKWRMTNDERRTTNDSRHSSFVVRHSLVIFGLLLLLAFTLRFANLAYSEFQGDEALAMVSAAEAIEGHADALFLRGKGPGEVLLPTAVWRLNGPITEGLARVPFLIAGLAAITTLFLLARRMFSMEAALFTTIFFAAAGFTVGFSRIVQYQMIVLWMSALSLWCAWEWRQKRQAQWAFVSGLFLGVGLLAHYDAILIAPAIGWLIIQKDEGGRMKDELNKLKFIVHHSSFIVALLLAALPFYLPYLLDPQAGRTGSYLGDRIGEGLLKNNLFDFLHFNSFYSSFYYVLVVGLLLLGFVGWALYRAKWGGLWAAMLGAGTLLFIALLPNALGAWTAIPVGLVLLAVFLSPALNLSLRTTLIWFAAPFLGYNFIVATPLTHIYTILPGWTLLAGWTAAQLRLPRQLKLVFAAIFILLSSGYLWQAFVQHTPEFLANYPQNKAAIYWTPFAGTPPTGFFGFPHKTGWKSAGALLANGVLTGDYDSNEEEDVTSWYTRHAPRACDPGAEFYFIASSLVDPVPIPADLIAGNYTTIAETVLANGNTLLTKQTNPPTMNLGQVDKQLLERQFDQSAFPAAFARSAEWQTAADVNFGGQVRLVGYDLNTRRAWPNGRMLLTLYWQPLVNLNEDYKVFVHLDSEYKYAQADSIPVCARYPTTDWRPGQIIADQHALYLSPETPPGAYPLVVGFYQPETEQRLDVLDIAGNPAGVSFTLMEVEVRENSGD